MKNLVAYTRTTTVYIDPDCLKEYFEIEDDEQLSESRMADFFAEIPINELIDYCESFEKYHEVTKI